MQLAKEKAKAKAKAKDKDKDKEMKETTVTRIATTHYHTTLTTSQHPDNAIY